MTIYYVDYNRGSDSNDGLSPGAPWKELTKIDDAAKSAGDALLLASDSVWEYGLSTRIIPPTSWVGTQSRPVVIGRYFPLSASTGKPTIRWHNKVAANAWTYSAPNNCWQYTAPGTLGNLMLIRLGGTWAASRIDGTQLPLASIDGRYSNSGSVLSLYAPSGMDPTTYYGEVLISSGEGFITISSQRGCVDIEDLRFEKTGAGVLAYSGSAFDVRVRVRRIDGETVSKLISSTSDSPGQLFFSVSDCNITDWGSCAIHTFGSAGTKDTQIFRNRITDGLHTYSQGAIYLQSLGSGLVTKVYENDISGVRWGTRDKVFDGAAIYAETGCDDAQIYRNKIHDSVCAMQDNSGRGVLWHSNLIYDCKTAMRCSDQFLNNATAHEFFNNTCIVGADKSGYASFGAQPAESGWRCYKPSGAMTSLLVRNNVFVNEGGQQAAAILTPEVTPTSTSYINNAAVGGYTNIAQRELSPFTVETSTGGITADPQLTNSYRPRAGSPLIGAGTHLGYRRDIERKQRPNPPSIGAHDVATMRIDP